MADTSDLLRLDDLLSGRERDLAARVRTFCEREVAPIIDEHWERAEFPHAILPGLGRLGVVGGTIDGWGAPGLTPREAGLVAMELARADGSISTFHGVHTGLAMRAIAMLGSDIQRDRWLGRMARLDSIGAFALTEPDHGSDAVALETRARPDGQGGWILDGRKRWIGNGTFADVLVVWARADDTGQVGAWLVDRGAPGLTTTPITGKIGKRASVQADVLLEGVPLGPEQRLPGARSFADAGRVLTGARAGVAWAALGHAVAAYDIARERAMTRRTFGKPLAGHQLVQATLARMAVQVTTMRLVCLRLAELEEAGLMSAEAASLAKLHNASTARLVVSAAREMMGGDGLLLENDVARHLTDIEVTITVEGTESMQSLIIGRAITGISAFGTGHRD